MAYITPSVLVYQQLEEAGGVLNTTPELEAVIVGPLYQNVYVDPSDAISMERSASITIDNWTDEQTAILAEDNTVTGFEVPLTHTYPGQDTDASSVALHMSSALVQVNEFDLDLGFAGVTRSTIPVTSTVNTVAFDAILPDGTSGHLEAGYVLRIEYDPGGGVEVIETSVMDVISGASLSISDPVPELMGVTASVKVYKVYTYIAVADTEVGLTDLANGNATLLFAANPFPQGGDYANYAFLSGTVHVGYSALRRDLNFQVSTINNQAERESILGTADENNPLSLAVDIALRNSTGYIKAISLDSNDSAGFAGALDVLEGEERAYYIVPLTQNLSIINSFGTHCQQLSTPEEGLWRVTIGNTELPEVLFLLGNEAAPVAGTGEVIYDDVGAPTKAYLVDDQGFLALGISPSDNLVVTVASDNQAVGVFTIEDVRDNNTIELVDFPLDLTGPFQVDYYISRDLNKRGQAEIIASRSQTFGSGRIWHIWPDQVGVEVGGVVKYLPGYYLCAAHAGANSGFPVQQGLTNIALSGIEDLRNSNFYFSRADLGLMAEQGTCIYAQTSQGGLPFCRHALTTDVSVLEYREQLKVKNWDFLSYYFKDKIAPFIGRWNITPDTLANMRQVLTASAELLLAQKLPRIGPPLLSYDIRRLEQNEFNKDMVDAEIKIEIVSPNNYTNIFLVI